MQRLPFKNESFDWVISDQVIEHLKNPQLAVEESRRVLRKKGIAIHTTCFMNPIHQPCPDYWRFSPQGLSYLCRNFSKIIISESWGNRIVILFNLFFPKILPKNINLKRWYLLKSFVCHNEKKYPIVSWIIAQK